MTKRTYRQYCPLARTMDILGERWTVLMIRELLLGPRRFKDLLEALDGMGTNLLSERLKMLEAEGLAQRRTLPAPAGSAVYELTERGRGLEPAMVELARWGVESLGKPREGEAFRPSWLALTLKATFNAELARGVHEVYEFRVDDTVFHARVDDGHLTITDGEAQRPDLVFAANAETFVAVGSRRVSPLDAVRRGKLKAEGPPESLLRCVEILGLPMPAQSSSALG
jgi:DNA-binding HxlR family transcriptional regulator